MEIPAFRIVLILLLLLNLSCNAQEGENLVNRKPVVAGSFYPAAKDELSDMLAGFFTSTIRKTDPGTPQAAGLVAPHAGYVFSGQVAAWSYAQLDPEKSYDNIFILGTSHYSQFQGASIYDIGNYLTPFGEVEVNREIARDLINGSSYFFYDPSAHKREHGIEVQLPFLQFHLEHPFRIVPIVLGTSDPDVIEAVFAGLEPYRKEGNIFILSTDFSHYPDYKTARRTDSLTARAFMLYDPLKFRNYIHQKQQDPPAGLLTPMCGWPSALVFMKLFDDRARYQYTPLFYRNSGDTKFGDKDRVVGYYSIMITQKPPVMAVSDSMLTRSQKILLLKIARETLEYYLRTGKILNYDENVLPDPLLQHRGAFVTLYKGRALRGCIGRFVPDDPLYEVVQQMAIAAAVKDQRFKPLLYGELGQVTISISVLTPPRKIDSADEFELGKEGIIIKQGNRSGTFLPQVAEETGWSKEEFLGHCSRDKAGLGWEGWKNADMFVFTADVFSEKDFKE